VVKSRKGQDMKDLTFDPFTLILNVMSFFKKGTKIITTEIDLHKFFLECKKEHSNYFKNILFDDDPDLPYSEEIADALLRIEDAGFLSRPNPAMIDYYIRINMNKTNKKIPHDNKSDFKAMSVKFKEMFIHNKNVE